MATLAQQLIITEVVEEYAERKLAKLEVIADPFMEDTWAIKAVFDDGDICFFLIRNVPLTDVTEEDLEEVQFTSWPPAYIM